MKHSKQEYTILAPFLWEIVGQCSATNSRKSEAKCQTKNEIKLKISYYVLIAYAKETLNYCKRFLMRYIWCRLLWVLSIGA